jgi:hypothetical protein
MGPFDAPYLFTHGVPLFIDGNFSIQPSQEKEIRGLIASL